MNTQTPDTQRTKAQILHKRMRHGLLPLACIGLAIIVLLSLLTQGSVVFAQSGGNVDCPGSSHDTTGEPCPGTNVGCIGTEVSISNVTLTKSEFLEGESIVATVTVAGDCCGSEEYSGPTTFTVTMPNDLGNYPAEIVTISLCGEEKTGTAPPYVVVGLSFTSNGVSVPWEHGGTYDCGAILDHPGIDGADINWSVTGAPNANINSQGVVTYTGSGGAHYTVTASATTESGEFSDTFTLTAVSIDKIQYQRNGAGWLDVPNVLEVSLDETVQFKAIPRPSDAGFPQSYANWTGVGTGSGETISIIFGTASANVTDYQRLTGECGNQRYVDVLVVEYLADTAPDGDFTRHGPSLQVVENTYWIARGLDENFTARPEDSDTDTFGRTHEDTFEKAQAIHWESSSTNGGTFAPEFGFNTVWTATSNAAKTDDFVRLEIKDDGKYYQDLSSADDVASIVVYLFDYSGVASIRAEDGHSRKHSVRLECVGATTVRLVAEPEDAEIGFEPGYPEWTIGGVTKTGPSVTFNLGAPVALYDSEEHVVECIGKSGGSVNRLTVALYEGSTQNIPWDFGKVADDLDAKLASFEKFSQAGGVSFQTPNGNAQADFKWSELGNSHEVIFEASAGAGFEPLIGINAEVPLLGPPPFIAKFFDDKAEAGVYLQLGGSIDLTGSAFRRPNASGDDVEYGAQGTASGTVNGSVGGKFQAGKYAEIRVFGSTSVTADVDIVCDTTGLGYSTTGHWGGLDVTVEGQLLDGAWEYSNIWTVANGSPIWQGQVNYFKRW